MTDSARICAKMFAMTERHWPRFFDGNSDIRYFMTADAVTEAECPLAVMTGAAGFALLHVRHGITGFVPQIENSIMARLAVIFDVLLFEMLGVVEYYLAKMSNLKGDILDVNRISERAGENNGCQ